MKPRLKHFQQEAAEVTEKFFSVFSAISCSNPSRSEPMKLRIQQEQTEITETEMEFSVSSVTSCSNSETKTNLSAADSIKPRHGHSTKTKQQNNMKTKILNYGLS